MDRSITQATQDDKQISKSIKRFFTRFHISLALKASNAYKKKFRYWKSFNICFCWSFLTEACAWTWLQVVTLLLLQRIRCIGLWRWSRLIGLVSQRFFPHGSSKMPSFHWTRETMQSLHIVLGFEGLLLDGQTEVYFCR